MERIVFNSDGKSMQYEMFIGTSLDEFGIEICRFLPCGRVFILTDSNVAPLFLGDVSAALRAFGIDVLSLVVSAGEENKRLETVQSILAFLLKGNASRSDVLLCFGGGVIGDMGGFAASVYMRGINFIAICLSVQAGCACPVLSCMRFCKRIGHICCAAGQKKVLLRLLSSLSQRLCSVAIHFLI